MYSKNDCCDEAEDVDNEMLLSLTSSRKSIGEFVDQVHVQFETIPWHVRDVDKSAGRLIKLSAYVNYYQINY